MPKCLGDQTGCWQARQPSGVAGGFYFVETAAGTTSAPHGHLWIGSYEPNGREVRRALKYLERRGNIESWSYSFGQPSLHVATSLSATEDAAPVTAPEMPPLLGESVLRHKAEAAIDELKLLDGGQGGWLAAEAARLEEFLDRAAGIDSEPLSREPVISGALRVVAKCVDDWVATHDRDHALRGLSASIHGLLDVDVENANPDISLSQKAIQVLRLSVDGSQLAPLHLKLIELAVNGRLDEEGIAEMAMLHRDVVEGRYSANRVWLCGVDHVTRDHAGYVSYKGRQLEHFSHSSAEGMRQAAEQLALICQRLERMGRPINQVEYHASWRELKNFPTQKYFVTAPLDSRYGVQTRGDINAVRVHPYRTQRELSEALMSYVTNWSDSPFRTPESLRTVYCADDDNWNYAKTLNLHDPAHREAIAERCGCNDLAAAAIIGAASSGEPQHFGTPGASLVDWIRERFIRGKYLFEVIEYREDAQAAMEHHSQDDFGRYDWHVYPNVAHAVRSIIDEGKLLGKSEVVRAFALADAPTAAASRVSASAALDM